LGKGAIELGGPAAPIVVNRGQDSFGLGFARLTNDRSEHFAVLLFARKSADALLECALSAINSFRNENRAHASIQRRQAQKDEEA